MTFSCKLSLFTQKIGIQTTMDMCTLRCLNTKAGRSEDAGGCTRVSSGKILSGLFLTKKLSIVTRIPSKICCCSDGTCAMKACALTYSLDLGILVTVLFLAHMGETDLFLILKLSLDKIFVKYSFVRCPIVHDMCQERKLFIRPLALLYIQKICNFLWDPFSC